MNKTKIEWVKNPDGTQGYTWNPITGCLNHNNGLCKGGGFPCYAYKLAHGRLRYVYMMGLKRDRIPVGDDYKLLRDPFCPHLWEDRLEQVTYFVKHPTHKGIFVCDMGELFGDWVPREWQEEVFDVIEAHPWHRFYLLTKQPQNLIKFSPFPDNCFVGVTATNRKAWFDAVWELQDIQAKVKYISFEPLLNWETGYPSDMHSSMMSDWFTRSGIKWVIIGAQTKPYKPPEYLWVGEIIRACDQAGIPVFLKDNLLPVIDTPGRQELPR